MGVAVGSHKGLETVQAAFKRPSKPASGVSAEKFYQGVPALSLEELQLPRVPRPPRIPPGEVTNEHALHCAMWLKGWIFANYGKRIGWSRRTNFARRRNWKAMYDGITALRKHGISAPRWIAFVGQMDVVHDSSRPPAFSTLFSRGIVTGQVDFCKRASTELGGRMLLGPKAKALAHDHSMMLQDLRLKRASTPAAIKAVVSGYFPGGSFGRRVAMVVSESQATSEALAADVAAVKWVW